MPKINFDVGETRALPLLIHGYSYNLVFNVVAYDYNGD